MNSFDVIKTVRLTEKAARLSTGTQLRAGTKEAKETDKEKRRGKPLNQYTFMADPRATKLQIRKAIEELFKVKVTRVNTLNVRGKARRQRTHQAGQDPNWKKAIVSLKEGDKIILT
jgi:large subunit ribosomal protein L23